MHEETLRTRTLLIINGTDFPAHSNYVELCLLLLGKQRPENGLHNVFAYVGDAATTQTRAGPAPPLVTGSFGPLDMSENLVQNYTEKH